MYKKTGRSIVTVQTKLSDCLTAWEGGAQVHQDESVTQYVRAVTRFYGSADIEHLRMFVALVAKRSGLRSSVLMGGTVAAFMDVARRAVLNKRSLAASRN